MTVVGGGEGRGDEVQEGREYEIEGRGGAGRMGQRLGADLDSRRHGIEVGIPAWRGVMGIVAGVSGSCDVRFG